MHYRVIALWKHRVQDYLDRHDVSVYALLPTMEGANYERLARVLDEMKTWYTGQERHFATHLLLFGVFLERSTMVTSEDKRRIKKKMTDSYSFLDESTFVQERKARAKEEGIAEGELRGEIKASQKNIVAIVRGRFPALAPFAQEQVVKINNLDTLEFLVEKIATAPDEAIVRFLLIPPAA